MALPPISVILAVLNESEFIDLSVGDLLSQDYEGAIEIIVADGGSTDGTLEKLTSLASRDSRVRVLANPERRQAHGLNIAAAHAGFSVLARADGHTRYAPDYLSRSVDALLELGGAVGGRMNPVGRSGFGRAVAAAMNSPLTMGPARFHHAVNREEVDTVYLGILEKPGFDELGGFRAFPSGSSEDADFYYRWRQSGRKVYVDPSISSTYSPRESIGSLWRQYWRYGVGKAEMLWVNGRLPSFRPLVPSGLVIGLIGAAFLALFVGLSWPLGALLAAWGSVLLAVGLRSSEPALTVMGAAGLMHLGYGMGMWFGLLRGPRPLRHLRG